MCGPTLGAPRSFWSFSQKLQGPRVHLSGQRTRREDAILMPRGPHSSPLDEITNLEKKRREEARLQLLNRTRNKV